MKSYDTRAEMRKDQRKTAVFKIAVVVVILLAAVRLLEIQALNSSFIFIYPIVVFVGILFLVFYAIAQLISSFYYKTSWQAIAIILFGLAVHLWVPFSHIAVLIDFKTKQAERTEWIATWQQQTAQNLRVSKRVQYIDEDQNLSNGAKQIIVEQFDSSYGIFFYTYRGWSSHFSGFVYLKEDRIPQGIILHQSNESFIFEHPKEIKRMAAHWYFVAN